MKCQCGKPAVIERDYEGRALCEEHFSHAIEKKVKQTIRNNDLIANGDRIVIGLSGGKDSSSLTYILHQICQQRPDLKLIAVTINEGIEDYRSRSTDSAQKLCQRLEIEHHVATFEEEYGFRMDQIVEKAEQKPCTYCGVFRRDLLNKKARELEGDKLAIAHNLDDEVSSAFMNYLKGDLQRLARLGPKTYKVPSENFVPRIKPMRNLLEAEIRLFSQIKELNAYQAQCPYKTTALRKKVVDFLDSLEEDSPTMKFSALATLDKLLPAVRREFYGSVEEVSPCQRCGEPSSGEICRKCQLLDSLDVE